MNMRKNIRLVVSYIKSQTVTYMLDSGVAAVPRSQSVLIKSRSVCTGARN